MLLPDYMASIKEDKFYLHRHVDFQSQSNRQSSNKHKQLITFFVKVSLKEYQKQPGEFTFQLVIYITPPLAMQTINF